jgi:hypothetical protein
MRDATFRPISALVSIVEMKLSIPPAKVVSVMFCLASLLLPDRLECYARSQSLSYFEPCILLLPRLEHERRHVPAHQRTSLHCRDEALDTTRVLSCFVLPASFCQTDSSVMHGVSHFLTLSLAFVIYSSSNVCLISLLLPRLEHERRHVPAHQRTSLHCRDEALASFCQTDSSVMHGVSHFLTLSLAFVIYSSSYMKQSD